MSVSGSCHCGAVQLEVPEAPEWVASCNCSLCRKLGSLVAYYPPETLRIEGETAQYVWGDRLIAIHHCPTCGCFTHWSSLGEDYGRQGINARLLDGFDAGREPGRCRVAGRELEIRFVNNAD